MERKEKNRFSGSVTRNLLLPIFAAGFSAGLLAQTVLLPDMPARLVARANPTFQNGPNGAMISIPAQPVELSVKVELSPAESAANVYIKCGSDVTNFSGVVYDTWQATVKGKANLYLARPLGGAEEKCYFALQAASLGARLTASIRPLSGTQVAISALGSIYLAGQGAGVRFGNLSVPANSPPSVPVPVSGGAGFHIVAGGKVGGAPPEGALGTSVLGTTDISAQGQIPRSTRPFGLSDVIVPKYALVGVFLSDAAPDVSKAPLNLDFYYGGLQDAEVLAPALQQVFYVGNGVTDAGQKRVFVAPAGASRLFLASAAGGFSAAGSYTAVVNAVTAQGVQAPSNPILISGLADLLLIDQPAGTQLQSGSGLTVQPWASALTPMSSPPHAPVSALAGGNVFIRAISSVTRPNVTAIGLPVSLPSGGAGLAMLPAGDDDLMGVFTRDTIDRTATPPNLGGGQPDTRDPLQPLLQQPFFVGTGLLNSGQARRFTVPAGATRLYLATRGGGTQTSGTVVASITPDVPGAPAISAGGVVLNAGFAAGPIAPGSMVSIFGSNLGSMAVPLTASGLPTTLGGTQVYFDVYAAPLFFVSPTQIVLQVPNEMHGRTQALVTVKNNGIAGKPATVNVRSFAAGIFTTGTGDPIITDSATGALLSMSQAATRGSVITIWASGLGLNTLSLVSGNPSPLSISEALQPVTVTLKSPQSGTQVDAPVLYSGAAPGFIALDQVNVQIPASAPVGTVVVQMQSMTNPASLTPNPVTIAVK